MEYAYTDHNFCLLFFLSNSYVHIYFSLLMSVQLPFQALFSTMRQSAWHLSRFSTCLLQLLNGLYSFSKSPLLTVMIYRTPIQIFLIKFQRYHLLPSHFKLDQVLVSQDLFLAHRLLHIPTYIQVLIYFMWDGIA